MPILQNYSAGKQLLFLCLILLASVFIFTPFGILIAIPFVEGDIFNAIAQMEFAETAQNINLLKYFQIVSQIGLFILSSFIFALLISKKPFVFLNMNKGPRFSLIVIALLIGIVSNPFLNWVVEMNSNIHLPEALSGIENWMRQLENEAVRLTELFLAGTTWSTLIVNLIMMAILAGLGEELLLRGIVQPLFIRLTKNPHLGIWIAAALFSFMHFQFFGFIPRMLLGALFGYYYYWSRNLWIPIIAHILNNGFIVIYTFYSGSTDTIQSLGENDAASSSTAPHIIVLSIFLSISLTIAGLLFFYRESNRGQN